MTVGLGDTPQSVERRRNEPYIKAELRRRDIKEAQEQQYLQSVSQREQEAEAKRLELELQEQALRVEQERLLKERAEKQVSYL